MLRRIFFISSFFILRSSFCFSQNWYPLGKGVNSVVYALASYDSVLYVGGQFDSAGGKAILGLAQFDGYNWSSVGIQMKDISGGGGIQALLMHNGILYVGGKFDSIGGKAARNVAMWDGKNWYALGIGPGSGAFSNGDEVVALSFYKNQLYAGGVFDSAGNKRIKNIAKWTGTTWDSVGGGINAYGDDISALAVYKGELYAGGFFDSAGNIPVLGIARWDSTKWDSTKNFPCNGETYALYSYDSVLYYGAPATNCNFIAQWNDSIWDSVGAGTNSSVWSFTENKGIVYAGGQFTVAGTTPANCIGTWDGKKWGTLGSGFLYPSSMAWVSALTFFKGNLYAGGTFIEAGGKSANNIAVWGDSTLGVNNIEAIQSSVILYPNPNTGVFTIESSVVSGQSTMQVYNMLGEEVYLAKLNSNTTQVDLSKEAKGIYLYRVVTENGEPVSQGKFVIQ